MHASDTSSGKEDFQAFTALAADKLGRLLDNVELTLAYELVALRRAHDLASHATPLPALAAVIDETAAVSSRWIATARWRRTSSAPASWCVGPARARGAA